MVDNYGSWDWNYLNGVLTKEIFSYIAAIKPPVDNGGFDIPIWKWDKHKRFTVKSAYKQRVGPLMENENALDWHQIMNYRGPPRVKMCLWLLAWNKLLPNEERYRRHMTMDSHCVVCGAMVESNLHIVRDCVAARTVWNDSVIVQSKQIQSEALNAIANRPIGEAIRESNVNRSFSWQFPLKDGVKLIRMVLAAT
ncbi:hypothetical protein F3Y22_tig00002919pilonHSYRG00157 [Hibiscus syriacus]|uniref:Reverse transcriptase zinc-binding domain-containing protein n=1 Tax=Hibiscus syriacus TaxID=106335 RepID=A0A6A3CTL9_HIBSY|nr:hypothetical protein F3Y22_tig00002919pilonHSYRG00157 [Hibiscus syriacus]